MSLAIFKFRNIGRSNLSDINTSEENYDRQARSCHVALHHAITGIFCASNYIRLCFLEHNSLVYRLYSTYLISHLLITVTNCHNMFLVAIVFWIFQMTKLWGGGQNWERPIFRSVEISSIKIIWVIRFFYFRIYFLF